MDHYWGVIGDLWQIVKFYEVQSNEKDTVLGVNWLIIRSEDPIIVSSQAIIASHNEIIVSAYCVIAADDDIVVFDKVALDCLQQSHNCCDLLIDKQ